MANVLLPIINGTLNAGVCFASEQARLNAFTSVMNAVLNGETFLNVGDTKPSVENQGRPWIYTVDGRIYFFSGKWKSPVQNPSPFDVRLFKGSLVDLQTYDGGDTGTPSTESGPMWVEDTDFIGRSPMHPGLIPETVSTFAHTLLVGENYGDGSHVQTTQELAVHAHFPDATKADGFLGHAVAGAPATFNVTGGGDTINMAQTGTAGGNGLTPSVTQAMNWVHPVRGLYCIRRSNNPMRVWYVIP